MDVLIDTNILIPAEPTSPSDIEPTTPVVTELMRLVQETGGRILIHPDAYLEIQRDRRAARRGLRLSMLAKYPRIASPPDLSDELAAILGRPEPETHDAVDLRLLQAVYSRSADLLVTDDAALRRQARTIGLEDSVLTSSEALELFRNLYEPPTLVPPAVQLITCADLARTDPIFDSLRRDYDPGFDEWLAKAALMRRVAWVVTDDTDSYAGLTIIKEEDPGEHRLPGRLLKICAFKVSEAHRGSRHGELLLKPVLEHAHVHGYDTVFVESRPSNEELFSFLDTFGFHDTGRLKNGTDPVFAKTLRVPDDGAPRLNHLEFHVAFGPPTLRWLGVPAFIVPIQPRFHSRLFPEAERQLALSPATEPHANGIRKAYLSKGASRQLTPGSVLYFYRSQGQEVTVVGVVEDVHVLSDALSIVRAAGKRTLFSYEDIETIAATDTDVLVIGFRQARVLDEPISYGELHQTGVLKGPPQTVTSVDPEAATWLAQRARL